MRDFVLTPPCGGRHEAWRKRRAQTSYSTPPPARRASPPPSPRPAWKATIVELSWYGDKRIAVPLGGAFHSQRLRLVSSQVGQVSAGRRPRWDYRRRMEAALRLLADDRLDALLTTEIAFDDAPAKLPGLLAPDARLAPVIGTHLEEGNQRHALRNPLSNRTFVCGSRTFPANVALTPPEFAAKRAACPPNRSPPMFAVEVRDRIMIGHSLPDPFFGPAQGMHGATFVVDVAFFREKLTKQNVVVDIGAALDVLGETLKAAEVQEPRRAAAVQGQADDHRVPVPLRVRRHRKAARDGALGEDGKGLAKIKVTLHETDLARAWFEGPVTA